MYMYADPYMYAGPYEQITNDTPPSTTLHRQPFIDPPTGESTTAN